MAPFIKNNFMQTSHWLYIKPNNSVEDSTTNKCFVKSTTWMIPAEKKLPAGNLPELKYNETASYNLTASVRQKHSYSSNNEILKKIWINAYN